MEYGLENYAYQNVWEDVALRKIPVADGIPESGSLEDLAYTETKIQEPEEISVLLKKMKSDCSGIPGGVPEGPWLKKAR